MTISSNQVSRMLALVPYLRHHTDIPVTEVASDFGVSQRQIVKDLNVLWFCGLPNAYPGDMISIDMDALQADGVVRLSDADFLPKPSRFSPYEALALIVALRTIRATATPDQSHIIDTALAKLEVICGDATTAPIDVHVESADPGIQTVLEGAQAKKKRVAIRYVTRARDEENHREIDVIRMFAAQGHVFCEAWCYRVEDVRTFRLDRIVTAELMDIDAVDHQIKPKDLSEGLFTVNEDTEWAILDLAPAAHWLAEYYTNECIERSDNGIRRVKMYTASFSWLCRLVLKNAGAVTVVEPVELAGEIRARAQTALVAYDGSESKAKD